MERGSSPAAPTGTVWLFEDFELDVGGYELRRGAERIAMEPQVFEVLACLVANHGRLVTKGELIERVWPDGFITDGVLATRVMAARKAIGDTGVDQRLIRTVRGRGYKFVEAVAQREPGERRSTVAHASGVSPEPSHGRDLQTPATLFVGRETELAALEEMLGRPGCRLVTVAGPGGVGKTRLVAELARRLEASGREVAAASVELAGSDGELLVTVVAALGLALAEPSPEVIAGRIGAREVVLVLDNFEHLVETGGHTVAKLVALAPGLRMVVTSREVLGLREEWVFPVPGLAHDAPGGEAVQLFLERERQAAGPLQVAQADAAVAEICGLVDGLPLALELAASLRRYLSRDEVARLIREDVAALRSDLRNLPERHRTIPGLFEESCSRLDDRQLRALLDLSVFEGAFTLEAAGRVAGATLQTVTDLVDRSLAQSRGGRFVLHPLLRQYARDRLGERREALRSGHAGYFAAYLAGRVDALQGEGQLETSREIEDDLPNIVAAWSWACREGRLDLLGAAAPALFHFAQLRSRWTELRGLFERAVLVAEAAGEEHWQTLADLLVFVTWARIRTSPGPEVIEAHDRAELLLRKHEALPPVGLGTDTVAIRALVLWAAGRYERMSQVAEEARQRASSRRDTLGEAYALWLGAVSRNRRAQVTSTPLPDGRHTVAPADAADEALLREAGWYLDRASVLLAARNERWFLSNILFERALNTKALGDFPRAASLARQSYDLRREFGDSRGMADALFELAGSYMTDLDAERAAACCAEAQEIVRRLGDPGALAELERTLAQLHWLRQQYEEALAMAAKATRRSIETGSVNNVLGTIRIVADTYGAKGRLREAAEIYGIVAAHPASPPFSRARAAAALRSDDLAPAAAAEPPADLLAFASGLADRLLPPVPN